MKTLKEQFNDTLTPNGLVEVSIETTKALADMVTQVDALLEECYWALQCPIKSQVMIELLKNNGYGNDAD